MLVGTPVLFYETRGVDTGILWVLENEVIIVLRRITRRELQDRGSRNKPVSILRMDRKVALKPFSCSFSSEDVLYSATSVAAKGSYCYRANITSCKVECLEISLPCLP